MNASRAPPSSTSAASPSASSSGLPSSARNRPSTRARVALPPAPCASVIELVAELRAPRPHAATVLLARPPQAPVVVVRGAGALARDHAGAERPLGRAGGAEDAALPRLDRAVSTSPQWQAFGSSTRTPGSAKRASASQSANSGRSCSALRGIQPSPRHSKVVAQLHRLVDRRERARVAVAPHDARVLVLDLAAALARAGAAASRSTAAGRAARRR